MNARPFFAALALSASVCLAAPPEPKFRAQEIDRIKIGYGLAIADVDGDKKPDIILADQKQFVWYHNPGAQADGKWEKHLLAENLTKNDNVCVAAQDIDGDGKCEIAVGAEWNPGDTVGSGAVFYLIAPEDRTKPWEAVKFPSVEPTTHRMRWIKIIENEMDTWALAVAPLHGRGNKNNEGAGSKVFLYRKPANPREEWKSVVISESMHATHNFTQPTSGMLLVGGKEGVQILQENKLAAWKLLFTLGNDGGHSATNGAGEVRTGKLKENELLATIEPMHGNALVTYLHLPGEKPGVVTRKVLTDKLIQGHALACGDLLGAGLDQIVAGSRGGAPGDKVGICLWSTPDDSGKEWRESVVDDKMACEDLQLADLDGDGDLDIIASGRATKNVMIYWNETKK